MHRRHWLERGAWASGIALLLLYGAGRLWSEASRTQGLELWRQAQAAEAEAGASDAAAPRSSGTDISPAVPFGRTASAIAAGDTAAAAVDQSLWSTERVRAFAESLRSPGVPEGVLHIPSLQLEVPIYYGASELNLNRGAARIEGTAAPGARGNIGIAAHRDGFFRALEDVRIDAELILDAGGRSSVYRVVEIGVVAPTDVYVLAPTDVPSITLVTCYPFYFVGHAPERYIVRAELVDPTGLEDAGRSGFSPRTINKGANL